MGLFSKIKKGAQGFFTVKEQKKRFTNVKDVLKQSLNPFSKAKPVANVKSKTGKAALEFLSSSPYTSAGLATGGYSLLKSPTKAIKAITSFAKKSPIKAAVGTTLAGAAVTSSTVRSSGIKLASRATPESLLKTGGKVGKFIDKPKEEKQGKDLLNIAKKASIPAAVTALALGGGAIVYDLVTKTPEEKAKKRQKEIQKEMETLQKLQFEQQKQAILTQQQMIKGQIIDGPIIIDTPKAPPQPEILKANEEIIPVAVIPTTPTTQEISQVGKKKSRKKRVTRKQLQPIRVSNRVNVNVNQVANKRYLKVCNY